MKLCGPVQTKIDCNPWSRTLPVSDTSRGHAHAVDTASIHWASTNCRLLNADRRLIIFRTISLCYLCFIICVYLLLRLRVVRVGSKMNYTTGFYTKRNTTSFHFDRTRFRVQVAFTDCPSEYLSSDQVTRNCQSLRRCLWLTQPRNQTCKLTRLQLPSLQAEASRACTQKMQHARQGSKNTESMRDVARQGNII